MENWRGRAADLRGMKVIVHHTAWSYLIRWSGLDRVASLERIPGVPPAASHLRRLLEQARGTGVKAIVRAPYEPTDASDWLSERTGIPIVELPYTVGGHPDVDDLFSLFDVTLRLLEDANNRP